MMKTATSSAVETIAVVTQQQPPFVATTIANINLQSPVEFDLAEDITRFLAVESRIAQHVQLSPHAKSMQYYFASRPYIPCITPLALLLSNNHDQHIHLQIWNLEWYSLIHATFVYAKPTVVKQRNL
ncbi:hypothetical protein ACH5RR_040903 [Cinchona calisaya]|uniref:Uncharacterized protein n=1 Tax=Cinchona calisaya TaxID=153742 RepID=A0ABD2XSL2_9GENT